MFALFEFKKFIAFYIIPFFVEPVSGQDWTSWRECRSRKAQICEVGIGSEPDIECDPEIDQVVNCEPGEEERFLKVTMDMKII